MGKGEAKVHTHFRSLKQSNSIFGFCFVLKEWIYQNSWILVNRIWNSNVYITELAISKYQRKKIIGLEPVLISYLSDCARHWASPWDMAMGNERSTRFMHLIRVTIAHVYICVQIGKHYYNPLWVRVIAIWRTHTSYTWIDPSMYDILSVLENAIF